MDNFQFRAAENDGLNTKMTDAQLNNLYQLLAAGTASLHKQGEIGDGGRARILFYALAGFLDERGIIDHLKAAAMYMAEHGEPSRLPLNPDSPNSLIN
jgi:hypothetical protein